MLLWHEVATQLIHALFVEPVDLVRGHAAHLTQRFEHAAGKDLFAVEAFEAFNDAVAHSVRRFG